MYCVIHSHHIIVRCIFMMMMMECAFNKSSEMGSYMPKHYKRNIELSIKLCHVIRTVDYFQ